MNEISTNLLLIPLITLFFHGIEDEDLTLNNLQGLICHKVQPAISIVIQ